MLNVVALSITSSQRKAASTLLDSLLTEKAADRSITQFIAALESQFGFKIFQVATNGGHRRELFALTENHGSVSCFQIP